MGDRSSGMLELLRLSGVSSGQWLATRLMQVWIGFLSVWIVRIPLLYWAFCLGGVPFERMVANEVLLLAGFGAVSSFYLLMAHQAESRKQANQRVMILVIVIEVLLELPAAVAGALSTYMGMTPPAGLAALFGQMRQMRGAPLVWTGMEGGLVLEEMWPPLCLYTALACGALMSTKMLYFSRPFTGVSLWAQWKRMVAPERQRRRSSRRCWDDALAWQSHWVHGSGTRGLLLRLVLYPLLLLGLAYSFAIGLRQFGLGVNLLTVATRLVLIANKSGDCLQRELKERTLSTLLLTPHNVGDLYRGWQRGMLVHGWIDVLYAGVLGVVMLATDPMVVVLVMIGIGGMILSSGPFLMLSPLVPFTVRGVLCGLGIVGALVAVVVLGAVISATLHPAGLLVVSLPLWWLVNMWLKSYVLPRWMDRKIATIV